MAKAGLIYYAVDTDRYQNIRIKRLKKSFGAVGIAVYDYVLNEIYRVRGCFLEWDENCAFDVADYFGIKENVVQEIVKYCGVVGLFDKALLSGGIVTSSSIQSRYLEMSKRAKRSAIKIPEEIRIFPEEMSKLPEISRNLPEEMAKTPEVFDKVKKSKVNKETSTDVDVKKASASSTSTEYCLTFEQEVELLKDTCYARWREAVCKNHHLTETQLNEALSAFPTHCISQGYESHKSIVDMQSHFNSWLRKSKPYESNNANREYYSQGNSRKFGRENKPVPGCGLVES